MLAQVVDDFCWYTRAQENFSELVATLKGKESGRMTLSELEKLIRGGLQGVGRDLAEAKMNEVGSREVSASVVGKDGVERRRKKLMTRKVETSFGEVVYERWGYGAEGVESLFPADGHLNLPPEKYTHEVRRLVSEDVTRTSYEEALGVLKDRTAVEVPKRQGIELANRAAEDFQNFYENRPDSNIQSDKESGMARSGSLLVITTDAKGVVMRPEGLRKQTKKAALAEKHKLKERLSRGEKRNRKRMAQVASVYTIEPHVRTPEQVSEALFPSAEKQEEVACRPPKPENKRVWASVERGLEVVLSEMFQEAEVRDPNHEKHWVVLVDGNKSQLEGLKRKGRECGVSLTIIVDIIHVLEYLWKAAWAFFEEGSVDAEEFVKKRFLRILQGQSSQVAKGIRKMATDRGLQAKKREVVDKCADYLLKYRPYLRYDQYLEQGLSIATGVIEGACRHLVQDRMDITGARWGLEGAEAVLRLRSLRSSGDFKEYWQHHEKMEQERNHIAKYADGLPPLKENDPQPTRSRSHLRLVKSR